MYTCTCSIVHVALCVYYVVFFYREGFERHKFELRSLTAELHSNQRLLEPKVIVTLDTLIV